MALEREKIGTSSGARNSSSIELLEHIRALVEGERDKQLLTFDELFDRLRRWWCHYYKRPYKDPLLENYTFEELYYEYYDVTFSKDKEPEQLKEEIVAEDRDWAAEEEAKELAEIEKQVADEIAAAKKAEAEGDTIVDESAEVAADEAWAQKYIPTKVNPSADDIGDGGDISATFESNNGR